MILSNGAFSGHPLYPSPTFVEILLYPSFLKLLKAISLNSGIISMVYTCCAILLNIPA